jgi:hypothetical protein
MNKRAAMKSAYLYTARLLLGFTFFYLVVTSSGGQTEPSKRHPEALVRQRIAAIIRETIKEGEGETIINGVKTKVWTRAAPSNEAIEELKRYGDGVVPILAEYIAKSKDVRVRQLAMRCLGMLGGERIIEPLRTVIKNDPSPDMRDSALQWITQAPWALAEPIIREAAETDTDLNVREAARKILKSYEPK